MTKNLLKITTILSTLFLTTSIAAIAAEKSYKKTGRNITAEGTATQITEQETVAGIPMGEEVVGVDTSTKYYNSSGEEIATGTSTEENHEDTTTIKSSKGTINMDVTNEDGTLISDTTVKNAQGETVEKSSTTYSTVTGTGQTSISTQKGGKAEVTYSNGEVSDVEVQTAKGTHIDKTATQTTVNSQKGEITRTKNSYGSTTTKATTSKGSVTYTTKRANEDGTYVKESTASGSTSNNDVTFSSNSVRKVNDNGAVKVTESSSQTKKPIAKKDKANQTIYFDGDTGRTTVVKDQDGTKSAKSGNNADAENEISETLYEDGYY